MAIGDIDHLFYGFEVSSFFRQSLPYLKVVDCIRELRNDPKNMLLDEVT